MSDNLSNNVGARCSQRIDLRDKPLKKKRTGHTISFKLDVINYLAEHNNNVTKTASFYNISRKQVRYYRTKQHFYIAMSSKSTKKI